MIRAIHTEAGQNQMKESLDGRAAPGDRVRELTVRYWELEKRGFQGYVDAFVESGRILEEGKQLLEKNYRRWVIDELKISMKTAGNYLRLLDMSRTSPEIVKDWEPMGPTRLYRVASMELEKRLELFGRKREAWKDPSQVDEEEFQQETAPENGKQDRTSNERLFDIRRRIRALQNAVLEFKDPKRIEDRKLRQQYRGEISALIRALRSLHGSL